MKIIHFSDIHIGYKDKEYSNKYSVADDRFSLIIDNLQVKLQELNKLEPNEYVIIITGERYSQDFEMFLERTLEIHYGFI